MNILLKLLLAISSTSLLPTIFLIKSRLYLFGLNPYHPVRNDFWTALSADIFLLSYFLFPLMSILLIFNVLPLLSKDEIKKGEVVETENITYRLPLIGSGYFFVALSIPDNAYLIFLTVYFILLILTALSQTYYLNPLFILPGYDVYKIKTRNGLSVLLISKSKYRTAKDISANSVYRIDNALFIDK